MAKLIFHVDVNSAFLSWEAARRVANGEPDIRLIPSVIGGDREKRTGVVLAKSIPAKKFGIKTGEPIGMALRKCPDLFMAKPDFRLYEENSKKFMDICREYAPVVEKASIDECYLDMSGTHRIYPDPVALAHTIKDRIRNELGFTVNVGMWFSWDSPFGGMWHLLSSIPSWKSMIFLERRLSCLQLPVVASLEILSRN